MLKLNRKYFYYKFPFRPIYQSQVDAINFLLDRLERSESIDNPRKYAYTLATIKHETGNTYLPVTEKGSEKYLKSKSYYPYIGRGYVQLTWLENYKKFTTLLGINLVNYPQHALDRTISWRITEIGMTKGPFTGKKLSDYFNDEKTDWINARKIINGLDRAELIASYAQAFHAIIKIND